VVTEERLKESGVPEVVELIEGVKKQREEEGFIFQRAAPYPIAVC